MKPSCASFVRFLRRSKKTILLIIVVAAVTVALTTTISMLLKRMSSLYFPTIGTIQAIGVEAYDGDVKSAEGKQYLDWGVIYPGGSTNRTFYLRSDSNVNTKLNMNGTNWVFKNSSQSIISGPSSSSQYMNLTWDYGGGTVEPGGTLQVTLTLSVDDSSAFIMFLIENDIKEFSLDVNIQAVEV